MTTGAHGGYQPPAGALTEPYVEPGYTGATDDPSFGSDAGSGSTTQAAKDQAGNVASTASDEARNVAAEAKSQARNLANETQNQVREQAGVQKDKAAGGLRNLSDELRSMSQSGNGQSGMASDLARQASEKAHDLASWLESREPGDLVTELRDFARRKPGTFLIGAAAAGVLAGRLTRSAVDVKRDDSSSTRNGQNGTSSYGSTSSAGSEWAGATAEPRTEAIVVQEDVTLVGDDPYATAGRRTGGDHL